MIIPDFLKKNNICWYYDFFTFNSLALLWQGGLQNVKNSSIHLFNHENEKKHLTGIINVDSITRELNE